jgi:pyruvate/2-oxoglutarate dehydrogenase complex dihydrolipoamide acyltransferase (E2) component
MRIEVPLPSLGDEEDTASGGTIVAWLAELGAELAEGDDLLELTTDKAAFVVASPAAGRLVEQAVAVGDKVSVSDVLCILEA